MVYVIRDELDKPLRSMADGKVYTSKSAMRRSYLASGNPQGVHYLEVGNDPARFKGPPERKKDEVGVQISIERAKARYNRGERPRDEK